ncbi:MAG: hypothetical protein AAF389_09670 [Gemmatimonadota bacterium]
MRPVVTVACCALIAAAVTATSYRSAHHGSAENSVAPVHAGPPIVVDTDDLLRQVADVRTGRVTSVALSGEDVTALVRESLPGLIPAGVVAPRVDVADGRLSIHADLVAQDFPGADELGAVIAALPDTASVSLGGVLVTRGDGWISYRVDYASVEGVPVPLAVVRSVLAKAPLGAIAGSGGERRGGDGPPSVRMRLPRGVGAVYAIADHVIVERVEPIVDIVVDQDSP